jgi:hypothetical protein
MKYLLLGIFALGFAVPAAARNAPGVEAHAGHTTHPAHGTKAPNSADREHEHMIKDGEKCCCDKMKDHHMQHEEGAESPHAH